MYARVDKNAYETKQPEATRLGFSCMAVDFPRNHCQVNRNLNDQWILKVLSWCVNRKNSFICQQSTLGGCDNKLLLRIPALN